MRITIIMSERYNISAAQGSTLLLNINCSNSNGSAINFSGYSVSGFVRYNYSSTGRLLNLNPSIYSAVSGIITISGSAADMSSLNAGIYVYDIEARNGDYVFKPIAGYFAVDGEVTR
jgi:hypothetical protein